MEETTEVKYGHLSPDEHLSDKKEVLEYYKHGAMSEIPISIVGKFKGEKGNNTFGVTYTFTEEKISWSLANQRKGELKTESELANFTDILATALVQRKGYVYCYPERCEEQDGHVNPV